MGLCSYLAVGFLKGIFGGETSNDPVAAVRKTIKSQRPPIIAYDFKRLATDYVLVYVAKNAGPEQKAQLDDAEIRAQLVADWAERLENMVLSTISDEVNRLGKADEFNLVLDQEDINSDQYLFLTIPDYEGFLQRTVQDAVVKLGGPRGRYPDTKTRTSAQ